MGHMSHMLPFSMYVFHSYLFINVLQGLDFMILFYSNLSIQTHVYL